MSSPDISVKSDTRLDTLLREKGVQLWRIPILALNGGVKVFRGKQELALRDASVALKAGDTVRLIVPMPKACAEALQREVNVNWRDYAIVPGDSKYDLQLKKFIQARTNTVLLKDLQMQTLQGFVRGLASSLEITRPIRDLLVVSHASNRGSFRMWLYPPTDAEVSKAKAENKKLEAPYIHYEDLEEAVKNKSIVLDVALMYPRPVESGGITHPHLRLLGCEVGGQAPYMQKLKEALGGKIEISAPKHRLVGASFVVSVASLQGEVAYMAYNFRAQFPTPPKLGPAARTKRALIDAFVDLVKNKQPGFVLENGSAVPATAWTRWIPTDLNAKPIVKSADTAREFPNTVTAPLRKLRMNAPRQFGYIKQRHYYDGPSVISFKNDTGDEAKRKEAVKAFLEKIPVFSAKHPFPEYVRNGYATMDEFMDGWNWQFTYDTKLKRLTYNPIRDEYHVWQPITRVAGNTLIWNYYPTSPAAKKSGKPPPNIQLQVTNPFFFGFY